MAKNLIPEIAKLLGVEIGEEFKINRYDDDVMAFKFTDNALMVNVSVKGVEWMAASVTLGDLLAGKLEIIKLPWKPRKDIRVRRLPWADKYESVDNIPTEEWLSHGWYFVCNTCGENIEDMADFHINDKGYCCKKCFDEWEKENDS